MAIKCLKDTANGGAGNQYFGILEVNNMTAQEVRTKGSLPLDLGTFSSNSAPIPCEQGMLLVYDEAADVVRKANDVTEKVMLHNSDVNLYDERKQTLKDFALWPQEMLVQEVVQYKINAYGALILNAQGEPEKDTTASKNVTFWKDNTPFPRMFSLVTNDIYTTNTVVYDTDVFTDLNAIVETFEAGTPIYAVVAAGTGIPDAWKGYHNLVKVIPTGAVNVLKVVKVYTLPDGQPALRFEVWN